jgi:hypothetical protein
MVARVFNDVVSMGHPWSAEITAVHHMRRSREKRESWRLKRKADERVAQDRKRKIRKILLVAEEKGHWACSPG